jgi:phage regulator Rha-like protein
MNDIDYLERKEKIKVYKISIANCAGSFLFGYTTAIISGAILTISPYFDIEHSELLQGLLVRYMNEEIFFLFFFIFN